MAEKTTRTTKDERQELIQLRLDLEHVYDAIQGRFWMARHQREALDVLKKHLDTWIGFEK